MIHSGYHSTEHTQKRMHTHEISDFSYMYAIIWMHVPVSIARAYIYRVE